MPCMDGGPTPDQLLEERDRIIDQKRRLDLATRVACNLEKLLTEAQFKTLDEETQRWIVKHRKEDAKRRLREETERIETQKRETRRAEQAQTREAALAKLTPKERKALGL